MTTDEKAELATLLRTAAMCIENDDFLAARARITEFLGKIANLAGLAIRDLDPGDVFTAAVRRLFNGGRTK